MMKRLNPMVISLLLGLMPLSMPTAFAADGAAAASSAQATDAKAKTMTAEEFLKSLHYQSGRITLPNDIATLNLPENFRYLSPDDTDRVLVDAWGNPPGKEKTLGMIVPTQHDVLSKDGWGVVISYMEDGHVKDDDADKINYDDLLKQMQESANARNEERTKAGYQPLTIVGWAEKPSYNKETHKFYWAKELMSGNNAAHGLNYDIRVLGRKGVLVLSAVSSMDDLSAIKTEMPALVAATEFTKGNGYNDFDDKTDKVAEYGLAALVAGGVAAKLGLFGKLAALLIAFKKVIVVAVIAFFAGIKRFFSRKKPAVAVQAAPVKTETVDTDRPNQS